MRLGQSSSELRLRSDWLPRRWLPTPESNSRTCSSTERCRASHPFCRVRPARRQHRPNGARCAIDLHPPVGFRHPLGSDRDLPGSVQLGTLDAAVDNAQAAGAKNILYVLGSHRDGPRATPRSRVCTGPARPPCRARRATTWTSRAQSGQTLQGPHHRVSDLERGEHAQLLRG